MVVPIDDPLAVGRVGRLSAVGHFGLSTPADVDRVDLRVPGGVAVHHVGDLLAVGRVARGGFVRVVVGEFGLTSPTDFDRVDLVVVPVVGRIGYPAVLAGKGSFRLL